MESAVWQPTGKRKWLGCWGSARAHYRGTGVVGWSSDGCFVAPPFLVLIALSKAPESAGYLRRPTRDLYIRHDESATETCLFTMRIALQGAGSCDSSTFLSELALR